MYAWGRFALLGFKTQHEQTSLLRRWDRTLADSSAGRLVTLGVWASFTWVLLKREKRGNAAYQNRESRRDASDNFGDDLRWLVAVMNRYPICRTIGCVDASSLAILGTGGSKSREGSWVVDDDCDARSCHDVGADADQSARDGGGGPRAVTHPDQAECRRPVSLPESPLWLPDVRAMLGRGLLLFQL